MISIALNDRVLFVFQLLILTHQYTGNVVSKLRRVANFVMSDELEDLPVKLLDVIVFLVLVNEVQLELVLVLV